MDFPGKKSDNSISDETVYDRFMSTSDSTALRILLERYREELTFFIFGFLHNMEDAEDIMMDAFATVASGTAKFSKKSSFKTWLFGIGRNLALKSIRKKHFLFLPLNDEVENTGTEKGLPDVELLKEERNRQLYEALENIPADYRQVLHLTYFEGMSNEEVAAVMDKNKKQIYNLIERGKKALKSELEKTGFVLD